LLHQTALDILKALCETIRHPQSAMWDHAPSLCETTLTTSSSSSCRLWGQFLWGKCSLQNCNNHSWNQLMLDV